MLGDVPRKVFSFGYQSSEISNFSETIIVWLVLLQPSTVPFPPFRHLHFFWEEVGLPSPSLPSPWFLQGLFAQKRILADGSRMSGFRTLPGFTHFAAADCHGLPTGGKFLRCSHIIYYHILSYIIIYYHILSYIIIYYHILSYIIIYYHILSYIIIYYHILSYIIIYYHILSYIIIYYHILSYIIIYYHILLYIMVFHIISIYIRIYICFYSLFVGKIVASLMSSLSGTWRQSFILARTLGAARHNRSSSACPRVLFQQILVCLLVFFSGFHPPII